MLSQKLRGCATTKGPNDGRPPLLPLTLDLTNCLTMVNLFQPRLEKSYQFYPSALCVFSEANHSRWIRIRTIDKMTRFVFLNDSNRGL